MKRLISLILFLATVGAVTWALYAPPGATPKPDERRVADVARWRAALEQKHPQVVLLGNSMLGHGINVIHFAMRTGLPTVKMWDGGVASAWRYLMLKNLIAASPDKPEVVIIFFRDHYLTEPSFRVDGEYKSRFDALRHPTERLLDQLAYGQQKRDPLAYLISDVWPLDRQRESVKPTVEKWVKAQTGRGLRIGGTSEVDEAISRVFADGNLNTALFTQAQAAAMGTKTEDRRNFKTLLDHSFLPAEIAIARKEGIRLIYVRIKRVPDAQAQEEGRGVSFDNAYMVQYMKDLLAYLDSEQVPLLDFTQERQIKVRHYGDGDHLNEEGRLLFTSIVSQALKGKLPAPHVSEPPFSELTRIAAPIVLHGPYKAYPPFGWIVSAPELEKYASGPGDVYRSVLEVLEDGTPLGPRNSYTSEISAKGSGRYSHWGSAIYFSASDNSDPSTNGRVYSVRFTLPG